MLEHLLVEWISFLFGFSVFLFGHMEVGTMLFEDIVVMSVCVEVCSNPLIHPQQI